MSEHAPLDVAREWAAFSGALEAPERAQDELLREILGAHSGTRYGRRWDFAHVRSLRDYQRAVPIVTFAELAREMADSADGVPDVLVAGKPVFLAQTSGTSAAPKYLPFAGQVVAEQARFAGAVIGVLERDHPGSSTRTLSLFGRYGESVNAAGLTVGSASGFARRALAAHPFFGLVPDEIWELDDFDARYHALLRAILVLPLRQLSTFNPSTILTLFGKAYEHAEALARELEHAARPDVARALRDSTRAHGRFVPTAIWPELALVQVWKGGMCSLYLPELLEYLPGCTIRPMPTSATEGAMFVPLGDDWVGGVPALTATVVELVPEDDGARGEPVPFADVQEGRGYRIVMTNHRGLYRMLADDVFYLERRHAGLPVMRFSHRYGMTSSLTGEKLTEDHVVLALAEAQRGSAVKIREVQLAPEWGSPPRYLLVLEPAGAPDDRELAAFLSSFERALARANLEYASKRKTARLADPELLVVARDHFLAVRERLAAARSDAQVKITKLARAVIDRAALPIERTIAMP